MLDSSATTDNQKKYIDNCDYKEKKIYTKNIYLYLWLLYLDAHYLCESDQITI